ncbi:MAG: 2-hydroxyhepta-2,4-diene-1,7-dioate isomerase [Verrucomicrobia bacterium]|nr:MAG: 2-hydroxyhepta-2,4-diene-1,7-dioate isomerase [Verrucomicrobiota bacterium]
MPPAPWKLFRTPGGLVAEREGACRELADIDLDAVFAARSPRALLERAFARGRALSRRPARLLAPVQSQEVWAAGVTYFRSRTARMEESAAGGGASFYDRVYEAERPELFFKATGPRVVGPGGRVAIRRDSTWDVPEPELTLAITRSGRIFGYTLGNDMSSRSIEGENPLYLPQAKVYDRACALGPAILIPATPLPPETEIRLVIERGPRRRRVFSGATRLAQMRRGFEELADWLYRELSFPNGAFLMTGTGIVPEPHFTLRSGDRIAIACEPIGTLVNTVI